MTLEAVLTRLDAMLAEQREQRAIVEDLARRLLVAEDRREAGRLLPLIAQIMPNEAAWTAAELHLLSHSRPDATDLRDLLIEWHSDTGGLRSFGRFLGRIAGTVHKGLRLVVIGASDRDGATYMVKRV